MEPPKELPKEETPEQVRERNLRIELEQLREAGEVNYSKKLISLCNLEQLESLMETYEHKRVRRLTTLTIERFALVIAILLHKFDCIGVGQVKPLTDELSGDEMLLNDVQWFAGKLIGKCPCPGIISGFGTVTKHVVGHKFKNEIKGMTTKFEEAMKEANERTKVRRSNSVVSRASTMSGSSSDDES